jgi:hypothetical protein
LFNSIPRRGRRWFRGHNLKIDIPRHGELAGEADVSGEIAGGVEEPIVGAAGQQRESGDDPRDGDDGQDYEELDHGEAGLLAVPTVPTVPTGRQAGRRTEEQERALHRLRLIRTLVGRRHNPLLLWKRDPIVDSQAVLRGEEVVRRTLGFPAPGYPGCGFSELGLL